MRNVLRFAAPLAVALFTAGCHNHVFSPPARSMPLETVDTLPAGDTGVQFEGGAGGALFGPNVTAGTVRVRRGVENGTDVSAEGSVLHVQETSSAGTNPNAVAARLGAKHRMAPFLSVTGGVGGGGSAAGEFVSPDVGVVLAWENGFVVPFLSLRASVSAPIGATAVDTSEQSDKPGTHVSTPSFTWIGGGAAGVRVPLGKDEAGNVRGSLLGGLGYVHLADDQDKISVTTLSGGAEIVF